MREATPFGQESRNLDIGINAILEFAVELQKILVLEQHRGIALFGRDEMGREDITVCRQGIAWHSHQLTEFSSQGLALRYDTEELLAERSVPDRIVQDHFFRASKPGDDGLRRRLRNRVRGLSDRDLHWQRISLRRTVVAIDFEEP